MRSTDHGHLREWDCGEGERDSGTEDEDGSCNGTVNNRQKNEFEVQFLADNNNTAEVTDLLMDDGWIGTLQMTDVAAKKTNNSSGSGGSLKLLHN